MRDKISAQRAVLPARVTVMEIEEALVEPKKKRTGADDELVGEGLKMGHRGLLEALATFFTSALQDERQVAAAWTVAKLKVLFKKGDSDIPSDYRPICIIPVLAKVYSMIL